MKNSYFWPATVACTLHAVLLLGFSKPERPLPAPPATSVIDKKIIKEVIEVLVSQDPVEVKVDDVAPAGGPREEKATPAGPEPEAKADRTGVEIAIPVITRSLVSAPTDGQIHPPGGIGPGLGDGPSFGPGTIGVSALDTAPHARSQAMPNYPMSLKSRGEDGKVVVDFTVDESGNVVSPRVVSASHSELVAPTLSAVSRWRFEPGRRNGRVVRFKMTLPVLFNLSDS